MKYSDSYIFTFKLAAGIFTHVMFYVMTYISGHQPSPEWFPVLSGFCYLRFLESSCLSGRTGNLAGLWDLKDRGCRDDPADICDFSTQNLATIMVIQHFVQFSCSETQSQCY